MKNGTSFTVFQRNDVVSAQMAAVGKRFSVEAFILSQGEFLRRYPLDPDYSTIQWQRLELKKAGNITALQSEKTFGF